MLLIALIDWQSSSATGVSRWLHQHKTGVVCETDFCSAARGVNGNDGVIQAISKAIKPEEILPCGEIGVRVNESGGGGVVVAALEVVQLRFGVVVIAPVA